MFLRVLLVMLVLGAGCQRSGELPPDSDPVHILVAGDNTAVLYDDEGDVVRTIPMPGRGQAHVGQGNVTTISPDGKYWAYFDDYNKLTVRSLNGDSEEKPFVFDKEGRIPKSPKWSPDSRYLAFPFFDGNGYGTEPVTIRVADLVTGNLIKLQQVDPPLKRGSNFHWSPDSKFLAITASGSRERLYIASLENLNSVRQLRTGHRNTSIRVASWSPDGKQLSYEANGVFHTIEIATASRAKPRTLTLPLHSHPIMPGVWSPDGQTLACTGRHCNNLGEKTREDPPPDCDTAKSNLFLCAPDGQNWKPVCPREDANVSMAPQHRILWHPDSVHLAVETTEGMLLVNSRDGSQQLLDGHSVLGFFSPETFPPETPHPKETN